MSHQRTSHVRPRLQSLQRRAAQLGCYRTYSLLFVPVALAVFAGLFVNGREFMWYIDGLNQYYPFFIYEGQWIRGIVGNLVAGNGLQIPLWEWCSGYGVDVPTTFDVFLDPLNLVSAITPEALSEWVFSLLVLLRLYLAGLAFVCYGRTRNENKAGIVLGALLYALCGSGLTGVRWSSGLHALMLFPLVLAGAEKVLAGKKHWMFVISLSMLAIVSYYFTYMAVILLVGYLALRVVMVEQPHLTLRRFMGWAGRFAGLTMLCMLVAGFALAPAACALMGMDRLVDTPTTVPLLYSASYYLSLVGSFLSTFEVGSDTYFGFGGLAFFACVLLFGRKEENRELKLVLIVLTAFLLLPCVGSFFNGMSYASNRWAWAYDLCIALALARAVPILLSPDEHTKRMLVRGTAAYAALLIFPPFRTEANVAGMAALLAALLGIVHLQGPQKRRVMLTGALALTLTTNGLYFLSPAENGIGRNQVPFGAAYPLLTSNSVDFLATEVADPTWWRYDAAQTGDNDLAPIARVRNNSLVLGVQASDFYNSVYNDGVDAFHTELGVAGDHINFSFSDLQGRSDLLTLLGMRYYALRTDGSDAAPYGFDPNDVAVERDVMGVGYRMVRSASSRPLGIAYDQALSRDEYLKLTLAQRGQALLQAVVLEDGRSAGSAADASAADNPVGTGTAITGAATVNTDMLSFEDANVPFTVEGTAGVTVEDGRFVVHAAGGTVTLACEGVPQADTYLYVSGLAYDPLPPSALIDEQTKAHMAWFSRINLLLRDLQYVKPTNYSVVARSNVNPTIGRISNTTPESHMYGGKDTWLAGMGYSDVPVTSVTLTFSQPGAYSYTDLQIVTQTHRLRDGWLAERARGAQIHMEQGCNSLSGTVTLDRAQTVLFTAAYKAGWTATIDGKPANLLRADTAFMALDVPAGEHHIELHYQTPGLVVGFCLSGAGIVLLALSDKKLRGSSLSCDRKLPRSSLSPKGEAHDNL